MGRAPRAAFALKETAAALADYCEAMALYVLSELSRATESGAHMVENTLSAAQANLLAARVLRETYDVDLWKYD